jgi:hypothetical protein
LIVVLSNIIFHSCFNLNELIWVAHHQKYYYLLHCYTDHPYCFHTLLVDLLKNNDRLHQIFRNMNVVQRFDNYKLVWGEHYQK